MAGKLTLIKKEVITTATSSITMTGINTNSLILPYQRKIFRYKAKFLRKLLNLLTIS